MAQDTGLGVLLPQFPAPADYADWREYAKSLNLWLENWLRQTTERGAISVPSYHSTQLPPVGQEGQIIYIRDEARFMYSDGDAWLGLPGGTSGSFTAQGGETVTVANGSITDIT